MKQFYDAKALAPKDFQKAEAAYMMAREQYSEAREGGRREDKAAASAASKRLADTKLLAPIAGMIARRGVNPGETIGAGMPVFSMVDLNPLKVRVGVPETDIARVRAARLAARHARLSLENQISDVTLEFNDLAGLPLETDLGPGRARPAQRLRAQARRMPENGPGLQRGDPRRRADGGQGAPCSSRPKRTCGG